MMLTSRLSIAVLAASIVVALLIPSPGWAYEGRATIWPLDELPIGYTINERGSDDLTIAELEQLWATSFAAWSEVPCSLAEVRYDGLTSTEVGVDEEHVMSFVESGWTLGPTELAATGTTVLSVAPLRITVDITFNGEDITWVVGGGGGNQKMLDPQTVMTHEIGHFWGLGHTLDDGSATMVAGYLFDLGQQTLSHDDKWGICDLYPDTSSSGECDPANDACPEGSTCGKLGDWWLCIEARDGTEEPCGRHRINCQETCVYTSISLETGFCTKVCHDATDCGAGEVCEAFGGTQVCRLGEPVGDIGLPDVAEMPGDVGAPDVADPTGDTATSPDVAPDAALSDAVDAAADASSDGVGVAENVEPPPAGNGDEGCGCALRAPGADAGAWLLVFLVTLASLRRRRA